MSQLVRKIDAGSRMYFVDLFTDRYGKLFCRVTESVKDSQGGRFTLFVHEEHMSALLEALEEASRIMRSSAKNG